MKKLIEDILYDRRNDAASLPLRFVLRLFSSVYNFVTSVRNFLYNKRILKARDLPCRVISIGNIIVGGTGKTPVTIMIAGLLKKAGRSVAVVSRGYKRQGKAPVIVSEGSEVLVSSLVGGDEPLIIASGLKGVPVLVGDDRFAAARLAYDRFRPDVIVLDDAFQHRRMYRNVDIVTMDAGDPIGSEYLLPRGLFRESPFALKRARAVVITRFIENLHNRDKIERMVRYYSRNVQIFWSTIAASGLRKPGETEIIGMDTLQGKKIAALSNIANPVSFYRLLEANGAVIVYKRAMPDHHRYSTTDIEDIENNSVKAGAMILVMTAKDEQSFPEVYDVELIEKLVLDIDAAIIGDIEEFMKIITPKIKRQV